MENFINAVINFSNWLWGIPMLVILVGGSIFLTIKLGFFQFKYFPFIMKETFGKMFKKSEGEGTVTPFQAATAALASTIGAANIVGVPVAIAYGGPGAVFWMWIVALIASAAKFSEITLGIKYRELNEEGEHVGGPMYFLSKGIKSSLGKVLGIIFSFFLMLEIIPSIATQSASAAQTAATINIPSWITGCALVILVGLVVFGGIKKIANFTEKLVPFMALLYIIGGLIIIIVNITELPKALGLIFKHAFTPFAAVGGIAGAGVAQAIRWGTARGVYSNEAGMGTAPIAHSAAITDHPARQAMWGIFEIVVDTLIVCTITALVVLVSGVYKTVPIDQAASMPAVAFQQLLGNTLGGGIATISMLLFVLSTIIVIAYYGKTQAEFLFGAKFSNVMVIIYLLSIILGVYGGIEFLYNFLDILLATIIIPNMIGLLILSDEVKDLKDEFFKNPKYYNPSK
ncbi:AGCS family alanine or glycine:cation symporter [Keratinibaculum paraultunense]|uniref:AGCS family alanine or glycine:cation symporter n=1 Tax=Keratinibaculum paraultunense TaxID=1278232 RepID=A0A4R3L070_9FIRM|nr:amino acid carrier protein [Keratinibaculum paraultunense]QQY80300.1 sodium:alanine symporter family protein [Keratinibaculum paraultunense]TCS90819.1 AGCS family alanine or glycine:cation symporter [Keratinibaculum paraultunense]